MEQHTVAQASQYRRELDDGLLLRWASDDDCAGIIQLYSHVFRDAADEPPNLWIASYTRDTMSGRHPLIGPGDFAVVEERATNRIVAATCLLRATWSYAGIPFAVGRPELVASHPDYRNRGLVRALFELIHARSAARGDLLQGITGIPFYYRQFGYEYALDLDGERTLWFDAIPKLKPGTAEPYSLRPITPADLPLVLRLYQHEQATYHSGAPSLVSATLDETYLRWNHDGATQEYSGGYWQTALIVGGDDRPLGYVLTRKLRWAEALNVVGLAVEAGVSLVALMPSLLRLLQAYAHTMPTFKPDAPTPTNVSFGLGRCHPAYAALGEALVPRPPQPYAWYVRVPDLPAFLQLIAPELERRLAGSVLAGHSGDLQLDFYRDGLRLRFAGGRLAEVAPWRPLLWGEPAQAAFPPLVFTQLLFGYRSLAELRHALPDVRAKEEALTLLDALFPAIPSRVMPQD